jgi:hypothetical protein
LEVEDGEQVEKRRKAVEALPRKAKAEESATKIVAAKAERILLTCYVARDSGERVMIIAGPTSNGAQFVL